MEAEKVKVDPRVCNIKVYVNGKSAELQEKLFELGCRWYDGTKMYKILISPFYMSIKRERSSLGVGWAYLLICQIARKM